MKTGWHYIGHATWANERGATAIIVAASLVMFLGVAALGVDLGYLYGVRNELQNSADAGALAGALELFDETTGEISTAANTEGNRVATLNKTGTEFVDEVTVQRGHWSFISKSFTPNNSLTQVALDERSFAELDQDANFINAVRVETRRSDTPALFSRIFGYQSFFLTTDAVAYLGFAGTIPQGTVDLPIAICQQALLQNDIYGCTMGRMINSGNNQATNNTGGWTSFNQNESTCQSGTNSNEMSDLLTCSGEANPFSISMGEGMAMNNGEMQSIFNGMTDCWLNNDALDTDNDPQNIPDTPWNVTLPVVDCPGNSIDNCSTVVGVVNVDIIWINNQNDPQYKNVPRTMLKPDGSYWTCTDESGEVCWNDFVAESNFNLKNAGGNPAPYQDKAIYFLPNCDAHIPLGDGGGKNFSILAEIPKLVE